jgi:hypothetical protein
MRTKLVILTLALIAMEGVILIFKNLSQSKELDGLERRVSASAYLRQKIGALREINSEVPIDAFKMEAYEFKMCFCDLDSCLIYVGILERRFDKNKVTIIDSSQVVAIKDME